MQDPRERPTDHTTTTTTTTNGGSGMGFVLGGIVVVLLVVVYFMFVGGEPTGAPANVDAPIQGTDGGTQEPAGVVESPPATSD